MFRYESVLNQIWHGPIRKVYHNIEGTELIRCVVYEPYPLGYRTYSECKQCTYCLFVSFSPFEFLIKQIEHREHKINYIIAIY